MSYTTSASNGVLIDTNVLVYAHDSQDLGKRARAVDVLDALIASERATLSVQCLTEFFAVVTRLIAEPMSLRDAYQQVELLARSCQVLDLTSAVVLEACRGVVFHQLGLWDSLIWAVAKLNQVPYILTEDSAHGRFLEGVRFLNPFSLHFDMRSLAG